jgi:protein-L-isoaspartate(D-aspartate) O-methyltransferase
MQLNSLREYAATLPSFLELESLKEEPKAAAIRLIMKLRQAGVRDTAILSAFEKIPREHFISTPFAEHAYEDTALPIDCGQTISQPSVVALMTQSLALSPRLRVLEIGTGSGYQTAILSQLCRMVYSIERHEELLRQARRRFSEIGLYNITARAGDGYKGWAEAAPFDRILITAAAPDIPAALVDQLTDNHGLMVIPVGADPASQYLLRITKTPDRILEEPLMKVRFVPMVAGLAKQEEIMA